MLHSQLDNTSNVVMLVQAAFLLAATLEEHPAMAPVVAREVERFLFRPGLAPRARYYAVIFLNQLQLSHDDARGELLTEVQQTALCAESRTPMMQQLCQH